MNEADLPSINLDELRLVPDWLRDDAPSPSQQYASFDRPMENDRQDRRGTRPGDRPGGFGGDRRDSRPPGGGGRGQREDRGRSGPPRGGSPQGRPDHRPSLQREEAPPVAPAPLRVEFLPDERCMASIIKQIRTTHLAYPLFSLARMFLQEPARHYLQLTLVPGASLPGAQLHQLGEDGPVTLDRTSLEKVAFDTAKDQFYKEESVQKDPPKGNFTNVARERVSGTLLGPTNYHGYQPALRSLYESRFSRRMSFEDYRRNIEVSSDPTLVERWKEEARTTTTISTLEGEPPTVLASQTEARAHFRQNHLENMLHSGMSFRLHGSVARRLPEPAIMQAIRDAHERELRYPAQFVQLLRQGLQNAGLHIFKHRKRIVYVAATRPTPFVPAGGAVTDSVALILKTIADSPLCTRKTLAERVLRKSRVANRRSEKPVSETPALAPNEVPVAEPAILADTIDVEHAAVPTVGVSEEPATPRSEPDDEFAKAKTALAADLRFLVQAGHIIEFHNGTFDLPLSPKGKEENGKKSGNAHISVQEDTGIGSDPVSVQSTESENEVTEEPMENVGMLTPPPDESSVISPANDAASAETAIGLHESEAEPTSIDPSRITDSNEHLDGLSHEHAADEESAP